MTYVELPYDYGTFVKVKNENGDVDFHGTVEAYTVTEDGYFVWVSGYKQPCCAECLPEQIELMTESEIEELVKEFG